MQSTSSLRLSQAAIAERTVELQYDRQPEIWKPYGSPGREKSIRDVGFHLLYLAEAVETKSPGLFVEYLAWVKSLFANLNFENSVLPTTLACLRQAVGEILPSDSAAPVLPIIEQGAQNLASAMLQPPSFIRSGNYLARQFLDLLLEGERQKASKLILDAVHNGMPVREVYLQVFENSQREVGRLWQTGQISVAQEHFCTAATQMIMSQLYPYLFTGERKRQKMVTTCVGGELHEIGARMVADFFEMAGWDTYFLGANTPTESVVKTVRESNAPLLAISVTMTFHISKARELIHAIREEKQTPIRILVGGYPFNVAPHLWKQIGADGYAPNAPTAIAEAQRLGIFS
jgi:methanogenic corrinoid protein MtbC1